MRMLLHKIYQSIMLILKQKGVFALIMGKQCTAALGIKHMEKKPNGSTEHDKSLKKGLTWPQSLFQIASGESEKY